MSKSFPPANMRAWQYSSIKGGLEKNLRLNTVPTPQPKPGQHLVQIMACALNPVDYKPAEVPFLNRLVIKYPATPGIDIVGRIVTPATGSLLKQGQLVFGAAGGSPFAAGGLREFTVMGKENVVAVPDGVDPIDTSTVAVAALTAYQSLVPKVKKGDKVFLNGGSGGTGTFGIQIAKAIGCQVTTTCSTPNVELCRSLGADEVIDYKKGSVLEALKASDQKFDLAVDNVGDFSLYWHAHEYTKPKAPYLMIAGTPSLGHIFETLKVKLWPAFLGGGKRKMEGLFAAMRTNELEQVGEWMREGKVKAVIDQRFAFEQAPQAFDKLKTGRAKGKIVVDVI